jgi:beta-glucosidase/6-phospho-beta-glucosidase/beta-galactosidase
MAEPLFQSFLLAGFECSSHRRADGRRLDLLSATGHDRWAASDYRHISELGLRTARDGLRWHLVERIPGHYDWSSFLPMLDAAEEAGVQVIWDLCHYGWPDDIDFWSPAFVERFARFAAAAAGVVRDRSRRPAWYCPINEISFWAWAGGDQGRINPCAFGRGAEVKRQLVRAWIAAVDAIREVDPSARFTSAEPLIHVASGSQDPQHIYQAEEYRLFQYEALDMVTGRREPELGGRPDCLNLLGLNFYPDNQWYFDGPPIPLGHHAYRPLGDMIADAARRFGLPVFLAETGAEGSARASWLHYVLEEVAHAAEAGVPVEGVCLYPVLDYPGWDNDRMCQVGLLSAANAEGRRDVHGRLLREMERQVPGLKQQRDDARRHFAHEDARS